MTEYPWSWGVGQSEKRGMVPLQSTGVVICLWSPRYSCRQAWFSATCHTVLPLLLKNKVKFIPRFLLLWPQICNFSFLRPHLLFLPISYPVIGYLEIVQSCIGGGLDLTLESIYLQRAWSNTRKGFLERW